MRTRGFSKLLLSVVVFLAIFFLAFYVSAQTSVTKSYDAVTKTVTISSGPNRLLELQLISNTDQCLVDCEATIRIKPYTTLILPSSPNDNFKWDFVKSDPNNVGLQGYSFEILETVPYDVYNYNTICNPYDIKNDNGTQTMSNCTIISEFSHIAYKQEYRPFAFWGRTLEANKDHYVKLKGKKYASVGENNIDWIPTVHGLQLNEFAWWNGNWAYTRPMSISNTNNAIVLSEGHPIRVNINTTELVSLGKMRGDCQDVRFVYNNATEMNYFIENCNSASTSFVFRLTGNNVTTNFTDTSFNMYYGNPGATYSFKNRTAINGTAVLPETKLLLGFNEAAGLNVSDVSPYGNNGNLSVVNTTWNTTSYMDAGVVAYGGTGTVEIANSASYQVEYNQDWTVEFWMWHNGQSGTTGFLEKADSNIWEYGFFKNAATGQMRVRIRGGGTNVDLFDQGPDISDSKWHHIALVSNTSADQYQLYIDGILANNATNTHTTTIKTGFPLSLYGSYRDVSNGAWMTTIDHLRITHRALTTAEMGVLKPEPTTALGQEIPLSQYANEAQGDQAIVNGINGSLGVSATVLTNQQIYIVNSAGGHNSGSFDKVATSGNQTWAFNYVTAGESFTNIGSLLQTVNIWENQTLTSADVESRVGTFINDTKG